MQQCLQVLHHLRNAYEVIWNSGGTDSKPAILYVKPDVIAIGSDWALKDYYKQMDFEQSWLDKLNISLIYIPYIEARNDPAVTGSPPPLETYSVAGSLVIMFELNAIGRSSSIIPVE